MKAIIIGASSGIGRELAKQMSAAGYVLGITARRLDLLKSLADELPEACVPMAMDLRETDTAVSVLRELIASLEGVDLIVINAGVGTTDRGFPTASELETAIVNAVGFTAMANTAYHYFAERGNGHIVGISSISALRGGPFASY